MKNIWQQKWNNTNTDQLVRAILSLETEKEVKRFLRDWLTEDEIMEFGRRFEAAQMLDQQVPYTQIVQKTGLSSTTVARISKWLRQGLDGYKLVLSRLAHRHNQTSLAKRL